ncbi:hypothetical protein AAHA92_10549 [Salvia divinorum]|uniref:Uncharacterized protein n=1 Tax=Salvia divinorum TaxID=28513 RepID=A0ABD1HV21_SALDI
MKSGACLLLLLLPLLRQLSARRRLRTTLVEWKTSAISVSKVLASSRRGSATTIIQTDAVPSRFGFAASHLAVAVSLQSTGSYHCLRRCPAVAPLLGAASFAALHSSRRGRHMVGAESRRFSFGSASRRGIPCHRELAKLTLSASFRTPWMLLMDRQLRGSLERRELLDLAKEKRLRAVVELFLELKEELDYQVSTFILSPTTRTWHLEVTVRLLVCMVSL